jgi:hypothetical protein
MDKADIRDGNFLLSARGAAPRRYRTTAAQRSQFADLQTRFVAGDVELAKVLPAELIEHAINQRAEFLLTCE